MSLFDTHVPKPPWTYRVRTWTAKIYIRCWKFHTQVVLVYLVILVQFTLEMRVTAWNREKFTICPISGLQGHWRSLMLTFLRSSSLVFAMISSMSVRICNHFHVRRANNGKITSKEVLFFRPFLICGDPLHPAAKKSFFNRITFRLAVRCRTFQ